MRIGHDENYLIIERVDEADPYSGFSIQAMCGYDDAKFSGSNGTVHFDQAENAKESFEEFKNLQRSETRIELTEGCSLVIHRLSRGDLKVGFRIRRYRLDATLDGHVIVSGEDTTEFLRDLGKMAYGLSS